MNKKSTIASPACLAFFFVLGCADQPHNVDQGTTGMTAAEITKGRGIDNQAAKEVQAKTFVEISFTPGSSELTDNAKSSLKSLMSESVNTGKVDQVYVLSWSDEEYPSRKEQSLNKSEVDLASRRNDAVRSYIKSMNDVSVDPYNMAKRPNLWSRWMNSTDAKLKDTMVAAGLPTTADDPQYPSKASHSVILVKMQE